MKATRAPALLIFAIVAVFCTSAQAQLPDDSLISSSRPVPTGKAPHMQVKLVKTHQKKRSMPWSFTREMTQ
jgi:uncharacterized protein